jgi:hypothetical protein
MPTALAGVYQLRQAKTRQRKQRASETGPQSASRLPPLRSHAQCRVLCDSLPQKQQRCGSESRSGRRLLLVPSERVRLNGGHARLRTISRSDVLDPSRRTCRTRPPPERRSPEAQAPRALTTVWATVALPRHDLGSRVSLRRAPWPRAASARRLASAARRRRTAGPLPPAASAGPRRREGKASLHSGDAGAGHDRRWLAFLHLAERGDRDAKILDPVRQVATQPLGDALGQGSSTPSGRSSCRRRWWPAGRPPTVRTAADRSRHSSGPQPGRRRQLRPAGRRRPLGRGPAAGAAAGQRGSGADPGAA